MEKSFLQAEAELSRFNAEARIEQERIQNDNRYEQDVNPVPHYVGERYDPEHPMADWAGNVPKGHCKKTFTNANSTKLQIDSQGGIMPKDDAIVFGSSFSGKRIFNKDIKHMSIDQAAANAPLQSAVYQFGPGGQHNCSEWKTSYDSQTQREDTDPQNYVLGKGPNATKKKTIVPPYEQVHRTPGQGQFNPILPQKTSAQESKNSFSRRNSGNSLLSGIGRSVVLQSDVMQMKPDMSIKHVYTDPANKSLLAENHGNRKEKL